MPLELNPIGNPERVGGFNTNFQTLENYINKRLLHRVGAGGVGNQLEQDLDMNGFSILNVSVGDQDTSLSTRSYVDSKIDSLVNSINQDINEINQHINAIEVGFQNYDEGVLP